MTLYALTNATMLFKEDASCIKDSMIIELNDINPSLHSGAGIP